MRELPCPSFVRFLCPEELLAVGEHTSHRLANNVRRFCFKRQNLGQKGLNALVHSSYSDAAYGQLSHLRPTGAIALTAHRSGVE